MEQSGSPFGCFIETWDPKEELINELLNINKQTNVYEINRKLITFMMAKIPKTADEAYNGVNDDEIDDSAEKVYDSEYLFTRKRNLEDASFREIIENLNDITKELVELLNTRAKIFKNYLATLANPTDSSTRLINPSDSSNLQILSFITDYRGVFLVLYHSLLNFVRVFRKNNKTWGLVQAPADESQRSFLVQVCNLLSVALELEQIKQGKKASPFAPINGSTENRSKSPTKSEASTSQAPVHKLCPKCGCVKCTDCCSPYLHYLPFDTIQRFNYNFHFERFLRFSVTDPKSLSGCYYRPSVKKFFRVLIAATAAHHHSVEAIFRKSDGLPLFGSKPNDLLNQIVYFANFLPRVPLYLTQKNYSARETQDFFDKVLKEINKTMKKIAKNKKKDSQAKKMNQLGSDKSKQIKKEEEEELDEEEQIERDILEDEMGQVGASSADDDDYEISAGETDGEEESLDEKLWRKKDGIEAKLLWDMFDCSFMKYFMLFRIPPVRTCDKYSLKFKSYDAGTSLIPADDDILSSSVRDSQLIDFVENNSPNDIPSSTSPTTIKKSSSGGDRFDTMQDFEEHCKKMSRIASEKQIPKINFHLISPFHVPSSTNSTIFPDIMRRKKFHQKYPFLGLLKTPIFPIQPKEKVSFPKGSGTVIFHIHGGGFVAMKSYSHEVYTRNWANDLNVSVFTVDYTVDPSKSGKLFPLIIEEVFQVYKWIVNHAHNLLPGKKLKKIVIAGDSAGGSLAIGVVTRAIVEKLRRPDSLILFYPSTTMVTSPSPSRIMSMVDPMVNFSFLGMCMCNYFDSSKFNGYKNPFLSPSLLPEFIMNQFPPTFCASSPLDPLFDDACYFMKRLSLVQAKSGRSGRNAFHISDGMCHGYCSLMDQCTEDTRKIMDRMYEFLHYVLTNSDDLSESTENDEKTSKSSLFISKKAVSKKTLRKDVLAEGTVPAPKMDEEEEIEFRFENGLNPNSSVAITQETQFENDEMLKKINVERSLESSSSTFFDQKKVQ